MILYTIVCSIFYWFQERMIHKISCNFMYPYCQDLRLTRSVFCLCFPPQVFFPHASVIPLCVSFCHVLVVFLLPLPDAAHCPEPYTAEDSSTALFQPWPFRLGFSVRLVFFPDSHRCRVPLPDRVHYWLSLSLSVEFLYSFCLRRWATGLTSWIVFLGQQINWVTLYSLPWQV